MKQVFKNNASVTVNDVPVPTPADKELLVAVEASTISTGTETMDMKEMSFLEKIEEKKHLIMKAKDLLSEKGFATTMKVIKEKINPAEQTAILKPIGYSNSGRVVAKGRLVKEFNVGDRVACCGAGIAAHAEYVVIPINLAAKMPDNVDYQSGAFSTIGSIAIQGIRRAGVSFGETIVITGLGLIGLLAVQIAKAWGLVVIGVDINPSRVELAKQLGADYSILANDPDIEKKIIAANGGIGVDAVIVFASTKSSIPANQSFGFCRRKGRVVAVGTIGMELDRNAMYMKELDFVISTSYGPGRYDNSYEIEGNDYPIGYVRWTENRNLIEFLRLLSICAVDVKPLISNTFKVEDAVEAYKCLVENPAENIASLFIYNHDLEAVPISKIDISPRTVSSDKIRVGVIGAGGFVKANHIKNMLKFKKEYEIVAIANHTPGSSKISGEQYGVRYATTDYKEILKDPEVDMVVIGTHHSLHASQVVDAVRAGKHVLVEKPLAITIDEINSIKKAIAENPYIHVAVGFNRRYADLIQKAKQVVMQKNAPVLVNYRINAGHIPSESWVQDLKDGGGRIIGEGCHFIDLITFLVGSKITTFNIVHIPLSPENKSEDNFIVSLGFENGSIGVLTYTSIGGKDMAKERIEVFCGASSMVIDNFNEIKFYNCKRKDIRLSKTDKGHEILIQEFAKLLKGRESLILPFETDIDSSEITIHIVEQMHGIYH
jgi:predicted dehydrogenase/threonine dehydrogenase-like Zn-dependent dehydrogenase